MFIKKTVSMFPGNNIPIIRGNMSAKRKLEELVSDCRDLISPDIGYDEGMYFAIMSSKSVVGSGESKYPQASVNAN